MTTIYTDVVNPNVSNFINSLRDIGYVFEVAVADILDNSIFADASNIKIYIDPLEDLKFCMFDDGCGMSEEELVEAMRLASKSPKDDRDKDDLGRFGLGLKTASFSQCRKLTVISKKFGVISGRQWDLDFISERNEWLLIKLMDEDINRVPFISDLKKLESGTLILWENIDRFNKENLEEKVCKLRNHLSLVFHRFLEGNLGIKKINIYVNNNLLKPFNPFNINNSATQQLASEKIKLYNSNIIVQPFILPHHSKISEQEYERYATEEGYLKTQGFYLYRNNRLLIYGTWWGLRKSKDSYKLVRIKIDISNTQDKYWGIDIKKSFANPTYEIKEELKNIVDIVTERGSRIYTGRGKKIEDKTTTRFWELTHINKQIRFSINKEHPILQKIMSELSDEQLELLKIYLKGLEAYLPLDSILAYLQQSPKKINQESVLTEDEILNIIKKIKQSNLDKGYIDSLLKTEIFKNYKGLLQDE